MSDWSDKSTHIIEIPEDHDSQPAIVTLPSSVPTAPTGGATTSSTSSTTTTHQASGGGKPTATKKTKYNAHLSEADKKRLKAIKRQNKEIQDRLLKIKSDLKNKDLFLSLCTLDGNADSYAASILPMLNLEEIYQLIPHFSEGHWQHLDREQALKFDFSKIEDESQRKIAFRAIFQFSPKRISFSNPDNKHGSRRNWLDSLLFYLDREIFLPKVNSLIPLFDDDHWPYLFSKASILRKQFDFTTIADEAERKRIFSLAFSTKIDEYFGSSNAADWLPKLSKKRIEELAPLFTLEHWKCIGFKHAKDFELAKIPDTADKVEILKILNDIVDGGEKASSAEED